MIVRAYAKLNLGLSVLRKRSDGFHDIDTIFALIDLFDLIGLEPNQSGISLEVKNALLPVDSDNLVYLAAQRYLEQLPQKHGVDIVLEKHIPIAAGLGGGSSDAAAVLLALKELFPSEVDILKIGKSIGSDVAFFLSGYKAAYGSSRGEVLIELELTKRPLLIINPGIAVSARDAYQELYRLDRELDVAHIVNQWNSLADPDYFNTLESSVFDFEPIVKENCDLLKGLSGVYGVLMSGSGSSCFALADSEAELKFARAQIAKQHPDFWLKICHTM